MPTKHDNWGELLGWLTIAWGAGFVVAAVWFVRWRRRRWLPPQRRFAVPWNGWEIFVVFLWVYVVIELTVDSLSRNHVQWLQWHMVLFPVELAGILAYLRLSCNARPYQMGLHTNRLGVNLILSYLVWFFLAMPVIYLNYHLKGWYSRWHGAVPADHPLIRLFESQPDISLWALITFSAAIAAPVREELLFRGILQPWLVRWPRAGTVVLSWALFLAFLRGWPRNNVELPLWGDPAWFPLIIDHAAPALLVALLIPGYFFCDRAVRAIIPDAAAARGIYASSLLFAAGHSNVWPTPAALFVFSLGLGYVAYRTRSLVGPIVAHALFNAISCIALLTYVFR